MAQRIRILVAGLMIVVGLVWGGSVGAGPEGLPNPFFAMDTGTRDANHATPQAQAVMLRELGYAGIGYSGVSGLKEMFEALDAQGLKLYTVYVEAKIGGSAYTLPDGLQEAMGLLKGRDVILWVTVSGSVQETSRQIADKAIVEMLQQLSDWGKAPGVRIALYASFAIASVYVSKQDTVNEDLMADQVRLELTTFRSTGGCSNQLSYWSILSRGRIRTCDFRINSTIFFR